MFNVSESTKERWVQSTSEYVRGIRWRTNKMLENYHAALRRRIQNLFVFLGHLHQATVDYMSDRQRLASGLPIRRPRRKQQLMNDTQPLQIPDDSADESDPGDNADGMDTENDTASVTGSAESLSASADTSDCCEVCLLQTREGMALVQCGHSRFCGCCADTVAFLDRGCSMPHTHSHGAALYIEWTLDSNTIVAFNEYVAIKHTCVCGRFMCIPLQCLNKTLATVII